jgi:hypothetical protein
MSVLGVTLKTNEYKCLRFRAASAREPGTREPQVHQLYKWVQTKVCHRLSAAGIPNQMLHAQRASSSALQ